MIYLILRISLVTTKYNTFLKDFCREIQSPWASWRLVISRSVENPYGKGYYDTNIKELTGCYEIKTVGLPHMRHNNSRQTVEECAQAVR